MSIMSLNKVIVLCAFYLAHFAATGFEKHDYTLELDHIVRDGINKSMLSFLYVRNVKPNRTYKAIRIHMGLKHDIGGDDFKMEVRGLQFFHNEYRPSPLLFDFKVCDAIKRNLFGLYDLFTVRGNFTTCPLKKVDISMWISSGAVCAEGITQASLFQGTYVINNFNVDASVLPPHLPVGRWQIIVRAYLGRSYIGGARWNGEIRKIMEY